MLTIRITNDGDGTNERANYHYFVYVNQREIEHGAIQGHNRKDGWAALVKSMAERHLTKRAVDDANAPQFQQVLPADECESGEVLPDPPRN